MLLPYNPGVGTSLYKFLIFNRFNQIQPNHQGNHWLNQMSFKIYGIFSLIYFKIQKYI